MAKLFCEREQFLITLLKKTRVENVWELNETCDIRRTSVTQATVSLVSTAYNLSTWCTHEIYSQLQHGGIKFDFDTDTYKSQGWLYYLA